VSSNDRPSPIARFTETWRCGEEAPQFRNLVIRETAGSHTTAECIITAAIEHLEEVDRGKSVSIDVRVSADLIDFQTGEILWHGSAWGDAVVEKKSVSGVVSQLSLGLGSAIQELAFPKCRIIYVPCRPLFPAKPGLLRVITRTRQECQSQPSLPIKGRAIAASEGPLNQYPATTCAGINDLSKTNGRAERSYQI
jgi:hypothetical protein